MMKRAGFLCAALLAAVGLVSSLHWGDVAAGQQGRADGLRRVEPSSQPAGQTTTLLPDGRWLFVGGQDAGATAWLWDPESEIVSAPEGPIQSARAWHSATLLPDGTVLLLGGQNGNALVETPEIFDPGTGAFSSTSIVGATARASHTATLLTDGRVLVVGGTNGGPASLPTEIWDPSAHTATAAGPDGIGRSGHTATLMADGQVLVSGGATLDGASARDGVAIDPLRGDARRLVGQRPARARATLAASIPASGTTEVSVDAHVALRFSEAMDVVSLSDHTLQLSGPDGAVAARVIATEGGRLAFVWPATPLTEGTRYVLTASGVVDALGVPLERTSITFTTATGPKNADDGLDGEEWVPDVESAQKSWRANRPRSSWESLNSLMAPPGVTAISGRVLTLDGRPLPEVTLAMGGAGHTKTDRTGRFLLLAPSIGAGRHVLNIAGKSASRGARQYGFFEYGMTVVPGQTNVLGFTIWMPKLDLRHTIRIPSPTRSEVVVTTPYIPGLELHIPPQTVIRDEDGKVVRELGITAIPVDRPPFPLAKNVDVPIYFTIQPGGAYVYTNSAGPKGAWLVYPNYRDRGIPGQRVQFYHYDPEVKDWYVYGLGTITPNAAQAVPDPTTHLYQFTGAMFGGNPGPAGDAPSPDPPSRGDPMDPATGIFSMHKTDMYLPDVLPLALTRTYNSGDNLARAFGRGMVNPYGMFLWSAHQYTEVDLVLPEGGKIHYVRTSSGTSWTDAVFEHTTTPTQFYKSTIAWNGLGWNLTLKDGTVYVFGENAPLQAIKDRYGNTVTVSHASGQSGNVTRVTSPNGRFLAFTYDGSNRVTQVSDNIGRTVGYTYDTNGSLSTVTDPESGVTTYTYDGSNRLLTIRDARSIVYVTNEYTSGRVTKQTLADTSATYQFSYTVDGSGNITQTDITDPRGHVERMTFDSGHYLTSDTSAYGTALARTTTTTRQSGTNLVTAVVDGLSRRTEYTYDSTGHALTATRLAGTADAVTTTFTYESTFGQLATVTDPLNHTWTVGYNASSQPVSVTDPLSHQTTLARNGAGQVTSVTDPLSHTWQFAYTDGDGTSTTSPLGSLTTQFVDAAGRVTAVSDPLGQITRTVVDRLNRVTAVTDPLGGQTSFTYDANSNLLTLTDALSHTTTYTYDTSDRVATRTDPLSHAASYQYDLNGNHTQTTDRKSQVTASTYDALDRLAQVTFADSSTISYTYDAGDRLTQIVDSASGTIARTFDGLDGLTQEVTPQGTVDYTYDAAGRRATMTVAGQTAVSYAYDNANRLTSITQGTAVVALTYDNANRRSTLTYPNGIVATYGYDDANQLTSLAYSLSGTPFGDLTYAYDLAGNRTTVGGSWARTGLPATLTSATYDAANRIASWGGTSFTHDLNGSLTGDGTNTYTWNARDQLASLSGGVSASFGYDGVGRRRGKTIGGATTTFLYDGLNFVQELSSGGTPTANLLTGLGIDETFTRTDGAGGRSLLIDALGSTLALAETSGAVPTQYTFEPFGQTTTSGAANTNAAQFAGRENDGTGLYFYRARFYSPALQRFVNEDPIEFVGGDVNLYSYVDNEPIGFRDPSGLARILWPPLGCAPPQPGRKDPPVPWWRRFCPAPGTPPEIPLVVPDLLPIPLARPGGTGMPHVKGPFIDMKPHPFPIIGPQPHIQINIWFDGIPGIQIPIRIPLPGWPWWP